MSESSVEVNTVLVPVDGSDESVRAVEYAVAIADRYGADVHALYVFGEEVSRAIETGTVEEDDIIDETESFIDGARAIAENADVELGSSIAYGFSTHSKLRHPGSTVLDSADEVDADFIVVPRETLADEPGDVLEKAAEYVLLYASQPVLSV
ncbi:universal stress protein UspA [Haladaptatus sp. R4]|uniref:universal stress protein n=1 Tax=Haladaptatus sp. R4 TaxID=1679489 RepID=UPI0007B4A397|nr:universal stress protein [Haladaptatus sp. R4]KZN24763.1 universal stress protein UspA [Haladaptatus sp. R4]